MLIVGVHNVRVQLESTTHDLRYTIRVLRRDDSRETDAHLHSALCKYLWWYFFPLSFFPFCFSFSLFFTLFFSIFHYLSLFFAGTVSFLVCSILSSGVLPVSSLSLNRTCHLPTNYFCSDIRTCANKWGCAYIRI